MLCEACGKNQATFFYKQTKNGYTIEKNLCSECAKKQGLSLPGNLFDFSGFGGDDFFGGLLGSFVGNEPRITASETCPRCGMTLGELLHGGRVGCSECYNIFKDSLMPTITKIHGNVVHCGKTPQNRDISGQYVHDTVKPENSREEKQEKSESELKLDKLKRLLREAIDKQEYEDAAKYRDEIRAIEKQQESKQESEDNKKNGGDAE